MQEALNRLEKSNLLITRATRLKVFAEKLGERGRYLIESEAYLVLEVFEPRPRAIWRYIRFAIKRWRRSMWFSIEYGVRIWWYTKVKGLEHKAALNLACDTINERAMRPVKGGD